MLPEAAPAVGKPALVVGRFGATALTPAAPADVGEIAVDPPAAPVTLELRADVPACEGAAGMRRGANDVLAVAGVI